jgi:uncharacterized protein YjiS (DUF1127 family)
MATHEFVTGSTATARLVTAAAAVLGRAADFLRSVHNRRKVAKLLEWDARMLRDIGLTPGDVRSAMASPLGEDPSWRLDALARERRRAIQAAARERLARQRNA